MNKIGIIGAMDIEIDILRKEMQENGTLVQKEDGAFIFYCGKINEKNLVVVKSGVGKVNAALCAQQLILKYDVDCVINTGIAGGMESSLHIHDLVVSTDALYHDMDATAFGYKICQIPQMNIFSFEADKNLIEAAKKAFSESENAKTSKLIIGRVASGDQFIAEPAVKAKILQNCSPACVEMEGAAIAHACFLNKIPFVIIRCISDNADESFESTYSFNEKIAAEECAAVVTKMLSNL